jgi:alpha-1,2-mannosyltransferase
VAVLLSIATAIGANHRASKGQCALLKWEADFVRLESGQALYGRGPAFGDGPTAEGYPTLPFSLLLLSPFRALGPSLGPLVWALFKIGLAWWIILRAFELAAGSASRFPPWAAWVVLLLSVRVLHSDVQHGNVNILVGAIVLAAFSTWEKGWDLRSGLLFGVAAVLKVTPLLGLLYLARKGSVRGLVGVALGVFLCTWVIPALWLGWEVNLQLSREWWHQMVGPYLAGAPLTIVQTEQINQSMLGVGARWLTDCIAIVTRPPIHPSDTSIHLLSLSPEVFRWVHRVGCALVLLLLWRSIRPRMERGRSIVLGEAAMVGLSMLILSERSWKQHYVLLPLALIFLTWTLDQNLLTPGLRRLGWTALAWVALLIGLSGDAVLGDRGADLAEAYGVWFWAAALLLGTLSALLRHRSRECEPLGSPRSP